MIISAECTVFRLLSDDIDGNKSAETLRSRKIQKKHYEKITELFNGKYKSNEWLDYAKVRKKLIVESSIHC